MIRPPAPDEALEPARQVADDLERWLHLTGKLSRQLRADLAESTRSGDVGGRALALAWLTMMRRAARQIPPPTR